jgi:peptide/nickel transport system ATP-binding protein
VRWAQASIVFQGCMTSLNPVQRVSKQIAEPVLLHEKASEKKAMARVGELFEQVGLPVSRMHNYPHQFSGGQKQRIMVAMALACKPRLILADEPTTALDVMVQAQVLMLMSDLVRDLGLTLVLISHDLSVLGQTCSRAAVMYAGRIVEEGPSGQVFGSPLTHTRPRSPPHSRPSGTSGSGTPRVGLAATRRIRQSCPPAVRSTRDARSPAPSAPRPRSSCGRSTTVTTPAGCRFHPRCPALARGDAEAAGVADACRFTDLAIIPAATSRAAACHLVTSD